MTRPRRALWILWAIFLVLLALELAVPYVVARRPNAWDESQKAVAGFVLALFALAAGVGTFALREPLALRELRAGSLDPDSPAGFARLRTMLFVLWALCLVIGSFGTLVAYAAATPRAAWPYVGAAAVLLGIHAPRHWLFASPAVDEGTS